MLVKKVKEAPIERKQTLIDFITTNMELETWIPKEFQVLVGPMIIATLAQRMIYTRHSTARYFPNLYVLLIGPSGCGKGTAIDKVVGRMLEKVSPSLLYPQTFTPEGLLTEMQERNCGIVCNDEIGNIINLKKYMLGTIEMLTELYESDRETYSKRCASKRYFVQRPYLNLMLGTQPKTFEAVMNEQQIAGGFLPRFEIAYASETTPREDPEKDRLQRIQALWEAQELKEIVAGLPAMVEVPIEKEAVSMIFKYAAAVRKKASDTDGLADYYTRLEEHLFKLALIFWIDSHLDYLKTLSKPVVNDISKYLPVIVKEKESKKVSGKSGSNVQHNLRLLTKRNFSERKSGLLLSLLTNKSRSTCNARDACMHVLPGVPRGGIHGGRNMSFYYRKPLTPLTPTLFETSQQRKIRCQQTVIDTLLTPPKTLTPRPLFGVLDPFSVPDHEPAGDPDFGPDFGSLTPLTPGDFERDPELASRCQSILLTSVDTSPGAEKGQKGGISCLDPSDSPEGTVRDSESDSVEHQRMLRHPIIAKIPITVMEVTRAIDLERFLSKDRADAILSVFGSVDMKVVAMMKRRISSLVEKARHTEINGRKYITHRDLLRVCGMTYKRAEPYIDYLKEDGFIGHMDVLGQKKVYPVHIEKGTDDDIKKT